MQKLHNIVCGNDFIYDTKGTDNKRKNKWDIMKIKKFCASNDTTHRIKSSPQKGEKFANKNLIGINI